MRINKVLLKKMSGAENTEEIINIAKENGKELSEEQAAAYLDALKDTAEPSPATENEPEETVEEAIDDFVDAIDLLDDDGEYEEITEEELRSFERREKIKRGILIGGAALAVTAFALIFKKKKK